MTQEQLIRDLRDEVAALRDAEQSAIGEHKVASGALADMRLQLERLTYESKEAAITTDAMREQNVDLGNELEDLKVCCTSGVTLVRCTLIWTELTLVP